MLEITWRCMCTYINLPLASYIKWHQLSLDTWNFVVCACFEVCVAVCPHVTHCLTINCGTHIPQWCYLWNSSPTLPGVNYSYTVHHWSIRVIKCFPTPFSMASSHRNVHWYSRHPCVSKTSGINHPSLHSQCSRFFPIKMEGHAA